MGQYLFSLFVTKFLKKLFLIIFIVIVIPLGITLNLQMEKVERIQYQAALVISGAWRGSSCSKLCEELGWENLSERRILQIHKISGNKTPSYLKENLPPNCRALFRGNIRNTFREIIYKSNRFKNIFFPDAIASWNIFIKHFFKSLKDISILVFDLRLKVFSVYTTRWDGDISFNWEWA